MAHRLSLVPAVGIAVLALAPVLELAPVRAGAPLVQRSARSSSPQTNWPSLGDGPLHNGYAKNSPLSTSVAPSLGLRWATDLYSAALDSPVVYFDQSLRERLAFIGDEHGDITAVDMADGAIVWSRSLGSAIRATPVVFEGSVFVGTINPAHVFKLNASTGSVSCSASAPATIEGSPTAASPPGGVPTVYFGTYGPLIAVRASDCSLEWSFTHFVIPSGTWDPIAYALDAKRRPLVLFGTADPDSRVYALDAVTGREVWRFASYNPAPHLYDVGAGVTVAPPGRFGIASGVAYVASKYGIMYALDLTTGRELWGSNFTALGPDGTVSTAALAGTKLVFGTYHGLAAMDALTGQLLWHDEDPASDKVISSPAVAGSSSPVVVTGDVAGDVEVVSLAHGSELYDYRTGGYVTASPAVSGGDVVIASTDGFLYDFGVGGGQQSHGTSATITSPLESAQLRHRPAVTVEGDASASAGVARVVVAVQAGGPDGGWWDAATHSFAPGPVGNFVAVSPRAEPGASLSRSLDRAAPTA